MSMRDTFWSRQCDKAERRIQAAVSRFTREDHGASAIEFAILAVPFLALIFAILELALLFFTASVLSHAVSDTGRLLRVGALQGCGGGPDFKALVCDSMHNLMDCENNLRIDVESEPSFQTVTFEEPEGPDSDDPDNAVPPGNWTETTAGDPVVIRATFYYPLMMPGQISRLENVKGSGRHMLVASTAFRNEPFPVSNECSQTVQDRLN